MHSLCQELGPAAAQTAGQKEQGFRQGWNTAALQDAERDLRCSVSLGSPFICDEALIIFTEKRMNIFMEGMGVLFSILVFFIQVTPSDQLRVTATLLGAARARLWCSTVKLSSMQCSCKMLSLTPLK